MLNARAIEEFDVFFYLRLFLAVRGFVDGHLDELVGGSHDDGFEGREFGEYVFVIDRPESVEAKGFLVTVETMSAIITEGIPDKTY